MTVTSGSIDTSAIDAFRQGVELTRDSHFVAGIAKIWSGYPDHKVPQTEFGQLTIHVSETPFSERLKFDSLAFHTASKSDKSQFYRMTPEESLRSRDGSLDPFCARSGTFDGTAVPLRGIKGNLESGNPNEFLETDIIEHEFIPGLTGSLFSIGPFVDNNDIISRRTYESGRLPAQGITLAFSDQLIDKVPDMPVSASSQFLAARHAMSPDGSDTFLRRNYRSMTCGIEFGDTAHGTDSIAFGGLTFVRRDE